MLKKQIINLALVMGVFVFVCAEAQAADEYHKRLRKRAYYSEEAKAERERTVTYQTVCFERYLHNENVETKEKILIRDEYGEPTMCGNHDRVLGEPVTELAHPRRVPGDDDDDSKSIFFFKDGKLHKGTRE